MNRSSIALHASVVASVLLAVGEARGAEPYADAGALGVTVTTMPSSTTQIAAPDSGGPYPLLVASHGWSASGQNQIGWAKHFASWGFVVAVPTFPSPLTPDVEKDSNIIVDLVNDLGGASASTYHVAKGVVGLEGHSAGGLATTVAAMKLGAAVSAVVLFDPVDSGDVGKAAYAKLCAPILDLFAQPSSCNDNAGWRPFASSTGAGVVAVDVVGSTHCDGENEDRGQLCGVVCGGAAAPERQAVYASYATAFFLAHLKGDAGAAAVLTPASVGADTEVANPIFAPASCTVSTDGGAPADAGTTPEGDAGGGSSPSPPPTSTPPSAPPSGSSGAQAAPGDSGETPSSSSGCGCRATPDAPNTALAIVGALAWLGVRRKRRDAP